jgi:hypothetical protein
MADETAAADVRSIDGIDGQLAKEFALEIDGQRVSGILAIRGLVAFRLDVRTTTAIRKLQEPFKITRMVQPDPQHPCNVWVRETFDAGEDIVRPARTLCLLALDKGVETQRWTVYDAWISEVGYSDFDSSSSDILEETLTIQYEDVEPGRVAEQEDALPAG